MKTKVHLIEGASLERIEELASSIDYRTPDWVPYTVAIEGTATSALDEVMVQTQHFSGLLRECSRSEFVEDGVRLCDESGGLHNLGDLLDDAAERLDQAHQEWLEVETTHNPGRRLDIEVRNVYGIDRFYPANDDARAMAEMLYGRKTINQEDLVTLHERFGFEVRLTNAVGHVWLPFDARKL
jgi:hypothetical protein